MTVLDAPERCGPGAVRLDGGRKGGRESRGGHIRGDECINDESHTHTHTYTRTHIPRVDFAVPNAKDQVTRPRGLRNAVKPGGKRRIELNDVAEKCVNRLFRGINTVFRGVNRLFT